MGRKKVNFLIGCVLTLLIVFSVMTPSFIIKYLLVDKETNKFVVPTIDIFYTYLFIGSTIYGTTLIMMDKALGRVFHLMVSCIVLIAFILNYQHFLFSAMFFDKLSFICKIILTIGLICAHILFSFRKQKEKLNASYINILIVLSVVIFPVVSFYRTPLIPRQPYSDAELASNFSKFSIQFGTGLHIFLIGLFISSLLITVLLKNYIVKKEMIVNVAIGLIVISIIRKITYIGENSFLFNILPDSPCAIIPYLALIFVFTNSRLIKNYLIYINMPLTFYNVLFLYTGASNNIFEYGSFDTIAYHIYASILCFAIFLDDMEHNVSLNEITKINVLSLCFQLTFLFLGIIQQKIESITNLYFRTEFFYGFGYQNLPILGKLFEGNEYLHYILNVAIIFITVFLLSLIVMTLKKVVKKRVIIN